MRATRLPALALLCLALALGCRGMETDQELQSLAGELPAEPAAAPTLPPAEAAKGAETPVEPASPAPAPPRDERIDRFSLGGSVFPGLGGPLHSALCDPALDRRSACI